MRILTAPTSRFARAATVGLACGLVTAILMLPREPYSQGFDFTYSWFAAREMVAGRNPYSTIFEHPMPSAKVLFYPLTAAVVALPLAWLPAPAAAIMFITLSSTLLAYLLLERGSWTLWTISSVPMFRALYSVQWSPLLVSCSLVMPALGLVAVKPNLALPLLAYQRSRRAVWWCAIGAALLLGVSLIFQPRWPLNWLAQFRESPFAGLYQVPLRLWYCLPLLLAALRWQRQEARLLLGMACIPQHGFFYDQLPLMLIPSNRDEMRFMWACSWIAYLPILWRPITTPFVENSHREFIGVAFGLYLPALILVLRRRRNVPAGDSP